LPTPPSAPTNLSANAVGPNEIDLSWNASTPGTSPIAGYQITRNGNPLTTVTGTSYPDTSVAPNTAYTYTVTAIDTTNATSPPSSPASATTPQVAPGQVTGVSALAVSAGEVDVSWNSLSNASAYELDRSSVSASGPFNPVATGITGTGYADKSVSPSMQYWYQVIASNSAGPGPASASIAVTTPAANTVLLSNTFEGGTNGAAITAANSGGASGNAVNATSCTGGATLTYASGGGAHGSNVSALVTPGTGACAMQWSKSITATSEAYGRAYINFAGNPTNTFALLRISDATPSRDVQVNLSKTGKLSVTDAAGTTQVTFTNSIPLNSWVRLEWHLISAASGTFELRMYAGDSTTPIESHVLTGINTGTSIGFYQLGALSSIPAGFGTTFKIDELAYGTGGWLGAG
jgi:hypothetical protein